jgi:hypothetical protein
LQNVLAADAKLLGVAIAIVAIAFLFSRALNSAIAYGSAAAKF